MDHAKLKASLDAYEAAADAVEPIDDRAREVMKQVRAYIAEGRAALLLPAAEQEDKFESLAKAQSFIGQILREEMARIKRLGSAPTSK